MKYSHRELYHQDIEMEERPRTYPTDNSVWGAVGMQGSDCGSSYASSSDDCGGGGSDD